jgi:hypothetical protein
MTRTRLGALCLVLAAVMFVLYPAVRPWTDKSTVEGAVAAMGSGAWVASHAFAILGFILVSLGLLSLSTVVRDTPGAGMASAAVVTSWVGAGLTIAYYGAEDFGLHAIAAKAPASEVMELMDAVRYNPVAITMFGVGLLALAVSGVLTAIAVARSGRLDRWAGTLFAAGYVLFLPQFFGPPALRIGHGVVLGLGLVWLAVSLWRTSAAAHR